MVLAPQSQLESPDDKGEALHATALQLLKQRNQQLEALHKQNVNKMQALDEAWRSKVQQLDEHYTKATRVQEAEVYRLQRRLQESVLVQKRE